MPNSGLIQAGRQGMADRFTHLPMIGLTIAVVWAAAEAMGQVRKVAMYAGVFAVAAFSIMTVHQIGYWHDRITLFRHGIEVEDSAYLRGNLGLVLMRKGQDADAEVQFRKAIQLAPDAFEYHNNLANVLVHMGDIHDAQQEGRTALRLNPDNLSARETMGLVLLKGGDYGGALENFDRAVQIGGQKSSIARQLNNTAAWLASNGRSHDAEIIVRRAVALDPQLVPARRNLVLVLQDEGRYDEARDALRQAIQVTGMAPGYRDLSSEPPVTP